MLTWMKCLANQVKKKGKRVKQTRLTEKMEKQNPVESEMSVFLNTKIERQRITICLKVDRLWIRFPLNWHTIIICLPSVWRNVNRCPWPSHPNKNTSSFKFILNLNRNAIGSPESFNIVHLTSTHVSLFDVRLELAAKVHRFAAVSSAQKMSTLLAMQKRNTILLCCCNVKKADQCSIWLVTACFP